eukprot:scaffold2159_cov69-Skeletonema_marinoi.AAC.2
MVMMMEMYSAHLTAHQLEQLLEILANIVFCPHHLSETNNILQLSSLILPPTMQDEKRQQPRKSSVLQEESISDAHSAGFPNASSIHLHDDVSQPSEQNAGNIGSESDRVKFWAA